MEIIDLSPDQLRGAINLSDLYDGWIADKRETVKGRLRWKPTNGVDYLYRLRPGATPGATQGVSLGRRSEETEALYEQARERELRVQTMEKNLLVKGRLYKALRLPVVDPFIVDLLRELDVVGLLGSSVRVIGSNAIPAYELEANALLPKELLMTEDFDMAWVDERKPIPLGTALLATFKKADPTWTVVEEQGFQLRNSKGEMVDIVIAESLLDSYPKHEKVRALATQGQEYLLGGTPVSQVLTDGRGNCARIVAPDPRLFALHKFYLSEREGRTKKKAKDRAQGESLMMLIEEKMPHYPFDEGFVSTLPSELLKHWQAWEERKTSRPRPKGLHR